MRWASVEWGLGMYWAPAGVTHGVASWVAAYNTTLSFGDCRLLAWYNWDPVSKAPATQCAAGWLLLCDPFSGRRKIHLKHLLSWVAGKEYATST